MRLGYPCINRSIGCTANSTFRLASYSEERLMQSVSHNLECLQKILQYNIQKGLLFFRISSDIIPFASHPICQFDWQHHFKKELKQLGNIIKAGRMRISMHPDQFVVLNSPKSEVVKKSIDELIYHCELLDCMNLTKRAKVQIHVGGVYNEKEKAMHRFIATYQNLPKVVKKRLIIEHDERSYSLQDCLTIHANTSIPIVFDTFHHSCLNSGETISAALKKVQKTWGRYDGVPIVHYSSQQEGAVKGKHTQSIDMKDFNQFIHESKAYDFDIMLEIKDKEKSALKALRALKKVRKVN